MREEATQRWAGRRRRIESIAAATRVGERDPSEVLGSRIGGGDAARGGGRRLRDTPGWLAARQTSAHLGRLFRGPIFLPVVFTRDAGSAYRHTVPNDNSQHVSGSACPTGVSVELTAQL